MAIIDQVTLRTGVADWLNRSDLTDAQLDDFISIGEARLYEELRVPPLEALNGFSVVAANSSITIPAGLIEPIELKFVQGGTCSVAPSTNTTRALCEAASGTWTDSDKDDDVILSRVDSKVFSNNKMKYAYTRELGNYLLTDSAGDQSAAGEYTLKYYKADDSVGTYSSTATAASTLVAGKYYTIATAGNTNFNSFTDGPTHANTAGVIFKASGAGSGTGTVYIETIPWILGTEFETILYAACTVGATFLGDVEMEQKFNELTTNKVNSLNQKEIRASMKGGSFSAQFSTPLL
jgi:hypothetical protein|tara:strand:+ start:4435 stop:5313 length:879 start_codon:yes stop_codon:yes gene_type:complete